MQGKAGVTGFQEASFENVIPSYVGSYVGFIDCETVKDGDKWQDQSLRHCGWRILKSLMLQPCFTEYLISKILNK